MTDSTATDNRQRLTRVEVETNVDQDGMIECLADIPEFNVVWIRVSLHHLLGLALSALSRVPLTTHPILRAY